MAVVPISVIIPTWNRPQQLLSTLARIYRCEPRPAEIIVHIDAGDDVSAAALAPCEVAVEIISSNARQGPGGSRNRLTQAARCEVICSFDDDSYPLDSDYFGRVHALFSEHPQAEFVAAQITEQDQVPPAPQRKIFKAAHFVGCGVSYRKAVFLQTGGYIPIALAYGVEEVDLCLKLLSAGRSVLFAPWLRVFHDSTRQHHVRPEVTAHSLSNIALLVFLRYPIAAYPYGFLQLLNRLYWLLSHGRVRGVLAGLLQIPAKLLAFRAYRRPVRLAVLRQYLALRKSENLGTDLVIRAWHEAETNL